MRPSTTEDDIWTRPLDTFNGDNVALCRSIDALLALDAAGALVPHGIGGHARKLLAASAARLSEPKTTAPTPKEQAK